MTEDLSKQSELLKHDNNEQWIMAILSSAEGWLCYHPKILKREMNHHAVVALRTVLTTLTQSTSS